MADDLTLTLTGSDWLGVVLATVASFVIGFLWFGPLFGKRWAKEFGLSADDRPDGKTMGLNMAKDLVGHLVMAYVLWHTIVVWIPSVWAEHLGTTAEDSALWTYAFWGALFVWLGFFLPVGLARTGWERRSWTWFGMDAGYNLLKLLAMALILMALH